MPRASPKPVSLMTTTVKENKPVWCSPGRPHSNLLRSGRGKPLGELKSGNRGLSLDGPGKTEKVLIPVSKKEPPVKKDSPSSTLNGKTKVRPAPAQVPVVRVPSPITSRPKTLKPPGTDETPPRSRPIKKPTALVTPTNKFRKPLATAGGTPRGPIVTKVSTPKGGTAKAITPSSRARSKNQANEETPVRKLRERTKSGESAGAQEIPQSGSRDNRAGQQQGVSGWAGGSAGGRGRKASPTHGRPPVKHLFLSPQVSKKTAKKDFVRKSIENHGMWVGSAAQRRRATLDKRNDVDSEMPPPAQPTNSPEIPKRGSREASGEGIRGYFGAGHMVAPDGMGFVRDRRKCKPRGALMVGQEGSMESDSSGVAESSVLMAPPSVASVEWVMNNDTNGNLDDFSSGSIHEPVTTSISEFTVHDNQASESFGKTQTSQEERLDGVLELEEMRLSSPNDDVYSQFTKRSQAFLQYLDMRQSQLTRAVSFSHARQSRHYIGHETEGSAEQPRVAYCDLGYEDITIDWRQGLPSDSMDMKDDVAAAASGQDSAGKKIEETVRSSLSFTSSWVPPPLEEGRRLSGHPNSWYAADSPWYGFSPITPEFHRNSQLPGGGLKAIDALLAGSVRRRIMTDQCSSSEKLDTSCTSLNRSIQFVNPGDSSSGLSSNSSQETTSSSSFQFARNSYGSAYAIEMEPMPLDNFMCLTSSPVERSPSSEDLICQTASPIDEVYNVACSMDCSVACSIDCRVDCSVDCSVNASDDDEVEYASPIMGDYMSPAKGSSPYARAEKLSTDVSLDDSDMGARAMRRSSMSRTLEELMRHNFTL